MHFLSNYLVLGPHKDKKGTKIKLQIYVPNISLITKALQCVLIKALTPTKELFDFYKKALTPSEGDAAFKQKALTPFEGDATSKQKALTPYKTSDEH